MANPVGNPGDAADAVRSAQAAHTAWAHLQRSLRVTLHESVRTARKEAQAIRRGRR